MGGAGGTAGQKHQSAGTGWIGHRVDGVARCQVVEHGPSGAVFGPVQQDVHTIRQRGQQLAELLIGEHKADSFAYAHIMQLWAGEPGVQQNRSQACLSGGGKGHHHTAMAAVEQADREVGAGPASQQDPRHGVGHLIELTKGQRSAFIGQRR
ncbi:hypothetical protein GCM10010533_12230 [Mycolicibacterium pallens]